MTTAADPPQQLFEAVRRACLPALWSRGVQLVRDGAVTGARVDGAELTCRVKPARQIVSPTVILYPEDAEWDCDCGSRVDPCEHVAAATIALEQARRQGHGVPQPSRGEALLLYRLRRDHDALLLDRHVVRSGTEALLEGTLTSYLAGEQTLGALTPSSADLTIDRIVAQRSRRVLRNDDLLAILGLLVRHPQVHLEAERVVISDDVLEPLATIEDHPAGYRVVLRADPRVREVLAPGVALGDGVIYRLGHLELTGRRLELLPSERVYGESEVAQLVTEVLPRLERSFALEVTSRRLPRPVRGLEPRIVLEVEQIGHTLSVLPLLVYGDPPLARVDGDALVYLDGAMPVRDPAGEQRARARLRQALDLLVGKRVHLQGDAATSLAAKLERWQGEVRGAPRHRWVLDTPLRATLEVVEDRFSVRFFAATEAPAGGAAARRVGSDPSAKTAAPAQRPVVEASAQSVFAAWRDGSNLVPLLGGGWAPIPEAWLAEHGHRVAELLAAAGPSGRVRPYALPLLAELCRHLDAPPPPGLARLRPLFESFEALPAAELPAGLTATLRDYQRRGVDWLCFLRDAGLGATLADDMGLGKTLQALCALRGRTLVVCPTSVVHNWQAELARFRPDLRCARFTGPGRALDATADVTLTSYALLRLDREKLGAVEWDTVVLDEAQAIKNPESQVAQAAHELSAGFRVTLSGTPVENRLDELWSQVHFTNPGLLGGRRDFQERFAAPIAAGDGRAAAALRSKLRPFVLRRLKREVAPELPARSELVLRLELNEEERKTYDAVRAATQRDVVAQLRAGGSVMAALEALLRLRQTACHLGLLPNTRAETSTKLETLVESLESAVSNGHRSLVFSQWTKFLDLIGPRLDAAGLGYIRLDGTTRDRQQVVARFQAEDGPPVMLLSLKAGGTGLNLTAADHVFLMDLWWNPAVEDQAADRTHRIGQSRPVFVHRLVAADTVEERILALQQSKRSLAEAALGDASQAGGLSREDLLALLE